MNSNEQLREASTKLLECMKKVVHAAWFIDANFCDADEAKDAIRQMESALALPWRNCDVGTVEEQEERFCEFCGHGSCKSCKLTEISSVCEIAWSQLPYDEVAND